MWNAVIKEAGESTNFTVVSLRKSVKLMIAEGSRLGLGVEQNLKILKVARDIASVTGKDLTDITQALLSAMTGQGQAALSLGIDIREVALAHSVFLTESGKLLGQLSEGEKTVLRYNEILKQNIPIMGAAEEAGKSLTGQQNRLEKTFLKWKKLRQRRRKRVKRNTVTSSKNKTEFGQRCTQPKCCSTARRVPYGPHLIFPNT